MKELTVFNPAAGKGLAGVGVDGYQTKSRGDCRRYIREACEEDPDSHFVVCGGDGTLNEAINGIMDAAAGERASFKIVPAGSGNDTIKSIPQAPNGQPFNIDLVACNDSYSINMINIGFDCNVVASAGRIKKKMNVSGKTAYILGVVTEFFKPFGEFFNVEATLEDGSHFEYSGKCLLCAVCNGGWCGGSFHSSPRSDMTDGVIELMLIKKMSRLKFVQLVGKYQKGTLMDPITGEVPDNIKHLVTYARVKDVKVSGMKQICIDGEVDDCGEAYMRVLPHAVRYRY